MDNFQFKRSDRVSQQIQDIISGIITTKVIVQELGLATVTKVNTSQNLRFSKIYLSFMGNTIEPDDLIKLMNQKKYVFVGSNIACFNAFFVLESEVEKLNLNLPDKNDLAKYTTSFIRESRSIENKLNYLSGKQKLKEIENCEVIDLSNQEKKLVKLKDIYYGSKE